MIEIKRTIVERHTIPGAVFRRKLGLPATGSLLAETAKDTKVTLPRWDSPKYGRVVIEVTLTKYVYRRNR